MQPNVDILICSGQLGSVMRVLMVFPPSAPCKWHRAMAIIICFVLTIHEAAKSVSSTVFLISTRLIYEGALAVAYLSD